MNSPATKQIRFTSGGASANGIGWTVGPKMAGAASLTNAMSKSICAVVLPSL